MLRVLLVGLGEYGMLWYRALVKRGDMTLVGVVDADAEKFQLLEANFKTYNDTTKGTVHTGTADGIVHLAAGCAFYTDAALAMDELCPDFVLSATPPRAHRSVNELAFDRGIPVLSEKPIAEDCDDALAIYARAQAGGRLVIAENYRYAPVSRCIRQLLDEGVIGTLTHVQVRLQKRHVMQNYHKDMVHPMLLDVGIHHLDMLRYVTGDEVRQVYADFYTPGGSWYTGYANTVLCMTMDSGVKVVYTGSLDAPANGTSWFGDWVFTGEKGILRYDSTGVSLMLDGEVTAVPLEMDWEAELAMGPLLDAFVAYMVYGVVPGTHIGDNIHTYRVAVAALRSFETKQVEEV